MANYPSFTQLIPGSRRAPVDDLKAGRTPDGVGYAFGEYTLTGDSPGQARTRYEFRLTHVLSKDDKVTLDLFYLNNRTEPLLLRWDEDDTDYVVIFSQPPVYRIESNVDAAKRLMVEVNLLEL